MWSDHVTSVVRRVRDGLVCGRIMFGSWADMVGSAPHCKWGVNCFSCMCDRQNSIVICNCKIVPALYMRLQVVLVAELLVEFQCALQLQDRSLTVNGIASGAGGGVADGVFEEFSHEMLF